MSNFRTKFQSHRLILKSFYSDEAITNREEMAKKRIGNRLDKFDASKKDYHPSFLFQDETDPNPIKHKVHRKDGYRATK